MKAGASPDGPDAGYLGPQWRRPPSRAGVENPVPSPAKSRRSPRVERSDRTALVVLRKPRANIVVAAGESLARRNSPRKPDDSVFTPRCADANAPQPTRA